MDNEANAPGGEEAAAVASLVEAWKKSGLETPDALDVDARDRALEPDGDVDAQEAQGADKANGKDKDAAGEEAGDEDGFIEIPSDEEGGTPERIPIAEAVQAFRESKQLEGQIDRIIGIAQTRMQERDAHHHQVVSGRLNQVEQVLGAWLMATPMPTPPSEEMLNPDSSKYDEAGFLRANLAYQRQMAGYQQAATRYQQIVQARQEQQNLASEAQLNAYAQEQERALIASDTAWGDPKTLEARNAQITKVMTERYGFTEEELGSVLNAKFIRAAWDLVKLAGLESAGTKEKVQKAAPRFVRGSNRQAQPHAARGAQGQFISKASQRLRETGSDDAARDMFLGMIKAGTIK